MAKRSTRSLSLGQWLVLLAVLLLASFVYARTGQDPLDLFGTSTPAPAASPSPLANSGEGSWRVLFTEPNNRNDPAQPAGSVEEALIAYIDGAQSTIHIASFEFDLAPVADALIAAHQRGVAVEWMTDDENGLQADADEGHNLFPKMTEAGIQVKDDHRSGLMHDKFWIFDGRITWTGSTNITANGIFENNNNAIIFDSPVVAAIYEREFAEMWQGDQFGVTSPSTLDQQSAVLSDPSGDPAQATPVQVLFAPEDGVAERLAALVDGAQHTIRFMAFSFTDEVLAQAMLARAKAGVEVTGIFETRGSETQYSMLAPMYCAGLPVRQDGNPRTFHHKVIVVDDRIVVTGSYNFTRSADESNDENLVIVTNPALAAAYDQEFQQRWAEAKEADPADMACR